MTIGFQEKRSQEKEFEVNADVPAALNDVGAEYIGNELTDESNKPIQLDISVGIVVFPKSFLNNCLRLNITLLIFNPKLHCKKEKMIIDPLK